MIENLNYLLKYVKPFIIENIFNKENIEIFKFYILISNIKKISTNIKKENKFKEFLLTSNNDNTKSNKKIIENLIKDCMNEYYMIGHYLRIEYNENQRILNKINPYGN